MLDEKHEENIKSRRVFFVLESIESATSLRSQKSRSRGRRRRAIIYLLVETVQLLHTDSLRLQTCSENRRLLIPETRRVQDAVSGLPGRWLRGGMRVGNDQLEAVHRSRIDLQ